MVGNINRGDFPAGAFSVLCLNVTLDVLLGRADFQRITIIEEELNKMLGRDKFPVGKEYSKLLTIYVGFFTEFQIGHNIREGV
jgi:hypothetical protein